MDICLEQMRQAGLEAHNSVRAYHGAQNLTRNATLEAQSQNYSQNLTISGALVHSHMPGVGENIFWRQTLVPLTHAYCRRKLNTLFLFD